MRIVVLTLAAKVISYRVLPVITFIRRTPGGVKPEQKQRGAFVPVTAAQLIDLFSFASADIAIQLKCHIQQRLGSTQFRRHSKSSGCVIGEAVKPLNFTD